ncbi:SDR family oxidoreductase [Yinghuangia sp. ASG 101]|uniref:SDR family NAD(P)-dependent oxidoreductase n=1 Tax=Yinghuangia sp. ASG 101 TaxID=2896848 RepID=UPI001E59E5C7|nr:glucose 1-dehydrogenase [Yinghuangia sp. ASG 101]UGQ11265.1 SDR family oxidoreductase [Yinghuangia sp. ASG 101]
MNRLAGKTAVVTGAASGIGAVTAERLAAEGARTVVADLNLAGAQTVADRIIAAGGTALAVEVDLGDADSVPALIERTVREYGTIDVLHNNAAATHLAARSDPAVAEADPQVWDDTMRINVRGTVLAIKAAVPHMIEQGTGSIINTSSGSGLAGDLRNPAYGASKAALNNLTRYVATQYGKQGVRCNAIAPGFIVTGASSGSAHGAMQETMLRHHLTPRLGRPEDVANAVVFLASDEAGFITGQTLCVDGGLLAHQPYVADMRQG